jgi:signal peptidase I
VNSGDEALPLLVKTRVKSSRRENVEAILAALLLALFIRTFVVEAFKIPSGSMLPTLQIGDHLLVNKFLYGPRLESPFTPISFGRLPGLRAPQAGDVIVFAYPVDVSQNFIKRVAAVAGQTVHVRGRQVLIDGQAVEDPHAVYRSGGLTGPVEFAVHDPLTVPPGHVFVLGDNRDHSSDSRQWGFVPVEYIKGRAFILYWSWAREDWSVTGDAPWVRWERLGLLVP